MVCAEALVNPGDVVVVPDHMAQQVANAAKTRENPRGTNARSLPPVCRTFN